MRLGILTGGGDAPGLNGIIEAVTRACLQKKYEIVGICDGFEGIFTENTMDLNLMNVQGISVQAGTILGTSNRCPIKGREREFVNSFKNLKLDGLIVAGGDGTFRELKQVKKEVPIIGIPKTIDNDISGTEVSFGYDTACSVVSDAVYNLKATAKAHRRIIFVETMGRTAGWIALGGGLSSYADAILIPERPFDLAELENSFIQRNSEGQRGILCVVSEGAQIKGEGAVISFIDPKAPQKERYGGVAERLARHFDLKGELVARHVVLGHLQRSTNPSTTDRMLALSLGMFAARLAFEGQWGKAVVYKSGEVKCAPLDDLMKSVRTIPADHRWIQLAENLGIFI